MKKIMLVMSLVSSTTLASAVETSLTTMYCTGYVDGVHTTLYGKGPSSKLLTQYALECEKDAKSFMLYMEVLASKKK